MDTPGLSLRTVRILRGPNRFVPFPVLQALLDADLRMSPADALALARRIARMAQELQAAVGLDVAFSDALSAGEPQLLQLLVGYEEEQPARAALAIALELAQSDAAAALPPAAALAELRTLAERCRLGPSTAAIAQAARRRDIPVLRLAADTSLLQLGHGARQRRVQATQTCNTSAIAVAIAQNKPLTNRLLDAIGVPVPDGDSATSADAAWAAARALRGPVVVKPEAGNQGKGVSVDLRDEGAVRAAYALAAAYGPRVLVERFIPGDDYRLLVVGGAVVAAARREPAHVIGDGAHSVAELVELVNQDPRRRPGHGGVLSLLRLDDAADRVLQAQRLERAAVPESGQLVRLRTNANLSTGGTASDVTDLVHPAVAATATLAAQAVGLDLAGIDIVCCDIGRPLEEQGGAVVEVNAAPGLRMHLAPSAGAPRDVGTPIVELLFPAQAPARIPIVAVTGTNGKTTVTRLVAHLFATSGLCVGMTTTSGVYVGGQCVVTGDCAGPQSARLVLRHPHVEAAVLEAARGGILREGLGCDGCDVGVVTNISADHLGIDGVETLDDLAEVKRTVVLATRPGGAVVLNADDPRVVALAPAAPAPVIYVSARPDSPVIGAHLAAGGRAALVRAGWLVFARGGDSLPVVELTHVPLTHGGAVTFEVENALAGAAAAWAAGLSADRIGQGLMSFAATPELVPGRFNVIEREGVQIVLDYGHNQAAMAALSQGIIALGRRRTIVAMCQPGDRRDEDLAATIRATLAFGDHYVLYDLRGLRGRATGEVPRIAGAALPADRSYEVAADQDQAIVRAWGRAAPGDRVVLLADESERALRSIESLPPLSVAAGPSLTMTI